MSESPVGRGGAAVAEEGVQVVLHIKGFFFFPLH